MIGQRRTQLDKKGHKGTQVGTDGNNRIKMDTCGHDQQDHPDHDDQQDQHDRPDHDDQRDDDQRRKNLGTSPGRGKAALSGGISTSRAPGSASALLPHTGIMMMLIHRIYTGYMRGIQDIYGVYAGYTGYIQDIYRVHRIYTRYMRGIQDTYRIYMGSASVLYSPTPIKL